MNNKLVFAGLLLVALTVVYSDKCASNCNKYKMCSTLHNVTTNTSFVKDSLVCSNDNDTILDYLFGNLSNCALREAAIETAHLFGIGWDATSTIEAILEDEEFFLDTCKWEHLAAAACVYSSLPANVTQCTNATITRSTFFCKDYCMQLFSGCFNLKKYRMTSMAEDACAMVTNATATTNCFKAQIHQSGASKPVCVEPKLDKANLTGPYIVAGIGLALAIVALIGLALITCRNGGTGGAPNSF